MPYWRLGKRRIFLLLLSCSGSWNSWNICAKVVLFNMDTVLVLLLVPTRYRRLLGLGLKDCPLWNKLLEGTRVLICNHCWAAFLSLSLLHFTFRSLLITLTSCFIDFINHILPFRSCSEPSSLHRLQHRELNCPAPSSWGLTWSADGFVPRFQRHYFWSKCYTSYHDRYIKHIVWMYWYVQYLCVYIYRYTYICAILYICVCVCVCV